MHTSGHLQARVKYETKLLNLRIMINKKRSKIFAGIMTVSVIILAVDYSSYARGGIVNEIKINPQNICAADGNPYKKTIKTDSGNAQAWILSGKTDESVEAVLKEMPEGFRGLKIEIVTAPLENADDSKEDVYRAVSSQIDPTSGKETNKIKSSFVRGKIPGTPFGNKKIELESCYPAKSGLPVKIRIERKTSDPSDTFEHPTALVAIKITPVVDPSKPMPVETAEGYNSWPMMQALGNKLVCAYSVGKAHSIGEGKRESYARVSEDGGKTWSKPHVVSANPEYGEVPIGKGLDKNGNMLLWIRFQGKNRIHKLYRTDDGVNFTHISTPKLNPMPMQITDIFHVPNVGLMALWFTGNYGENARNAWGTLVSSDNGKTWVQKTVESELDNIGWTTEPSAAYIGDGRIIAIARIEHAKESTQRAQFQIESKDYGKTWTKKRTNITDVLISTPSLIYDEKTGLISNYYYQRARGMLKRRVVGADKIFGNPLDWPSPEIIAFASAVGYDAGNANATKIGDVHYIAYYSGDSKNTSVLISTAKAPSKSCEK